MRVKAFEFAGSCSGCGNSDDPDKARGGVAIIATGDETEYDAADWFCLKCALKLAKRILKARAKCQQNIAAGMSYRHDKWQKAQKEMCR